MESGPAADGTADAKPPLRPGLLATGVLMFAASLLYANPYFGVRDSKWPWESLFGPVSPSFRADLLLWWAVGALAILAGIGRLGRRPGAWLAVPVLLLVGRCFGQTSTYTAMQENEPTLAWFASVVCLASGASILAARDDRARGTGRVLAAAGALGVVCAYAITFKQDGRSVLGMLRDAYPRAWRDLFGGAERSPELADRLWREWWVLLAPMACLMLAAGTSLVVSAARESSAATRTAARVAWILTLLRWVVPPVALIWRQADVVFSSGGVSRAAEIVGYTVFGQGLAAWLMASQTLTLLLRAPATTPAPTPEPAS
jgi:hypothetical protein